MFNYTPDDRGLTFDVNETFYFNASYGISEMLSISLDPDISVQSHNDYAQVRGLLILNGEFKKNFENKEFQPLHQATKQIEKIDDMNETIAKFYHRIPVEVTIPLYRIDDVNDIKAVVESFDYEMPNNYSLKINASLHVLGMNPFNEHTEKVDRGFIIHNDSEDEKGNKNIRLHEMAINQSTDDKYDSKNQLIEDVEATKQEEGEELLLNTSDETTQESSEEHHNIEVQLVEKEVEEEQPTEEKKDLVFLTELFNETEQVAQTKLTIHIIQEDDTIDTIASRYDIPITTLMKDNNLTEQDLEIGSLLKINMLN